MINKEQKTTINFKPFLPQIVIGLAGCLLIYLNTTISLIFGIFLILISAFVQFGLKDQRVCDIYADHIVFYKKENDSEVSMEINFDDVEEWNVNKEKNYCIYLKLNNGLKILRETFLISKANKALNQYMPEKETMTIQAKKNKETKLVFRNPFKAKRREKMDIKRKYFDLVKDQIEEAYVHQTDKINEVANLICDVMVNKGVVQLFGTKHANEFVNELNFRAGGLAPYHGMNVSVLDIRGKVDHKLVENFEIFNDVSIIPDMLSYYKLDDRDMIILISEKGNEPVVVELAKMYHENNQKVVAVVNYKSYEKAEALHSSGKKLLDYADIYLDMFSEEPDVVLEVGGYKICQTSSTVANVLAQTITAELYHCFKERGLEAPVLLSANIKGADVHNNSLTDVYEGRVR